MSTPVQPTPCQVPFLTQASTAPGGSVVLAFDLLQLIGAGSLAFIVMLAWVNQRITRLSTWYSFCLSWVIYSFSYCLLYLTGQQTGPAPEHTLCVAQSALVYGAPILVAGTTLSFVIHIYFSMRSKYSSKPQPLMNTMLQICPYVVWGVTVGAFFASLMRDPEDLTSRRNGIYCSAHSDLFPRTTATVVLVVLIITIVLQAMTFYNLTGNMIIRDDPQVLIMLFRLFLFNLGTMMGLGVCIGVLFLTDDDSVFEILLASFPVMVLAIFGLQADLFSGMFRGKYYR